MLWRLDTLLKESVDWKHLHIDMVLPHEEEGEEEEPKRNNEMQRPHTCWNPKRHVHLTGEFAVVM